MTGDDPREPAHRGARTLGLAVLACVACCVGPVLGAVGAVGIASVAGFALAGAGVALLAAGVVVAAWSLIQRRRRRRLECATQVVRFVPRSEQGAPRLPDDGVRR